MSFVAVLCLQIDLGRTAGAAVAVNANSNAANVVRSSTGQQAEVDASVPGGPRLAEGQPRVFHCALRLDEAGAATQKRVESQRHARYRGEK